MRKQMFLLLFLVALTVACNKADESKTDDNKAVSKESAEGTSAETNAPAAPAPTVVPTAESGAVAEPPVEPSEPAPSCEDALPAAAIGEICGKEFSLRASMMEGKSRNTCSRTGSGLYFIVSQHSDAATATRAQVVASQDDPMLLVAAKASGRYLIELKSTKDGACGSVEKLSKLATKAAAVIQ